MILAFGRIQRFGADFEPQCSVTVYREMCIILKSNLYIPEVTQHYTEICKFPVSSPLCGSKRSHAHLPGESLSTCPRPRRFVFIFLPSLSINLPISQSFSLYMSNSLIFYIYARLLVIFGFITFVVFRIAHLQWNN